MIDALRWKAATGEPWRALPPDLGHWSTVWRRCHWLRHTNMIPRILDALEE